MSNTLQFEGNGRYEQNHQQRVMDLQIERSELMMKPKRTAEENKRLAELVATENDWAMPLESVQKEYLEYFYLSFCVMEQSV